jgi:hypothetical protein
MKRYVIVVEKAEANYAAHVPDLPACVATEPSIKEAEPRLREAITLHVRGRWCPAAVARGLGCSSRARGYACTGVPCSSP